MKKSILFILIITSLFACTSKQGKNIQAKNSKAQIERNTEMKPNATKQETNLNTPSNTKTVQAETSQRLLKNEASKAPLKEVETPAKEQRHNSKVEITEQTKKVALVKKQTQAEANSLEEQDNARNTNKPTQRKADNERVAATISNVETDKKPLKETKKKSNAVKPSAPQKKEKKTVSTSSFVPSTKLNHFNVTKKSLEKIDFSKATSQTEAPFTDRFGHTTVAFNGKLWVIGGDGVYDGLQNEIWSSTDGTNWKLELEEAPFRPRYNHACLVFNDRMYVIGGQTGYLANDVWSSSDGINWQIEHKGSLMFSMRWSPDHNSFAPRDALQVVSFKNKIWLIGGKNGANKNETHKIWSSQNGKDWTMEVESPNLPKHRFDHSLVVFDSKIWFIGGNDSSLDGPYNDVWSSSDGINWTQVTNEASFPRRSGHNVVAYGDKMLLVGGWGKNGKRLNDIYSSADGKTWTLEIGGAPFAGRKDHSTTVFKDKIFVIGGIKVKVNVDSEVWTFGPNK